MGKYAVMWKAKLNYYMTV